MPKLQILKSLDEDPATVKAACHYVGWHLLSPRSWAYVSVFTGERGEVSLDKLAEAVVAKKSMLTGRTKEPIVDTSKSEKKWQKSRSNLPQILTLKN